VLGKKHIFLFLSFFLFSIAEAKELYGPEAGVVPYGMGRAYSAVADDWLALYYNPAGLALAQGLDIQIFDLKLEASRDVVKSISKLKEVSSDSSSTTEKFDKLAGSHLKGKVSNISQITGPNFAVAANYDVHTDVDIQNRAYPETSIRYTKDFSILTGLAGSIGSKKSLRFGATFKYINRIGGEQDINVSEIATIRGSLLDRFSARGAGYGIDTGIQFTFPNTGRAEYTLAWVWHDIGQTSFGKYTSTNRPTSIEDNMVAGASMRFPIGGKVNRRRARRYGQPRSSNHLTFAFDYSHMNIGFDREHFAKRLHLGMNLDLPILSFQVGMNQSALTLGAGFDIGLLRIAAATYGEELGNYAGQRSDRRYLLSISGVLGAGKF